ncbi:MAG: hypothetical protein J6X81_06770 [Muribaculaceae bacterium]|nr:hypothetical protein [Muribaculaceae bacterium]
MKNTQQLQPYFNDVLMQAKARIAQMNEQSKAKLKEQLEHGTAQVKSSHVLDMYLCEYGSIHQAKLELAFEHIPNEQPKFRCHKKATTELN